MSMIAIMGAVVTVLLAVVLPIALVIVLKKKTGKGVRAALVGALCFVVFAMVLEQLLHIFVIPLVMGNAWLYGIYGCLAAGLFEETGRLVGLTYLCKKNHSLATGLGYGIGHGGIEAILLAGIAGVANLVVMLQINAGMITAGQPGGLYETMTSLAPGMFWASGIERVAAIALHIALSVLIYLVVTKRVPFAFYFVAIVLHALVNVSAVMYQVGALQSIVPVEALVIASVLVVCLLVAALYKRSKLVAAEGDVNE